MSLPDGGVSTGGFISVAKHEALMQAGDEEHASEVARMQAIIDSRQATIDAMYREKEKHKTREAKKSSARQDQSAQRLRKVRTANKENSEARKVAEEQISQMQKALKDEHRALMKAEADRALIDQTFESHLRRCQIDLKSEEVEEAADQTCRVHMQLDEYHAGDPWLLKYSETMGAFIIPVRVDIRIEDFDKVWTGKQWRDVRRIAKKKMKDWYRRDREDMVIRDLEELIEGESRVFDCYDEDLVLR